MFLPGLYRDDWLHLKSRHASLCGNILAIVATHQPLYLNELKTLVKLPSPRLGNDRDLEEIVGNRASFLMLQGRTIPLVHHRLKVFCSQAPISFFSEKKRYQISCQSRQALSEILRHEIYQLGSPGYDINLAQPIDPDPLAAVQSSCLKIIWCDGDM